MDSADYDATNEEEDPLNPADIEGDANDDDDPKQRVIEHNESKVKTISASHVLVFDESMSAYIPR